MNKTIINEFYSQIDIDCNVIERIITTSKTTKPKTNSKKTIIIASVCTTVLVISIFSVYFLNQSTLLKKTAPEFSFDTISRFNTNGTKDQMLIEHDGFALWLSGAYNNGKNMYLALKGKFDPETTKLKTRPDDLRIAQKKIKFSVNDKRIEVADKEIILNKKGEYYEGVLNVNVTINDSIVLAKLSVSSIDVYDNNKYTTTINGPFCLEEGINHIYTTNEENLINNGNEIYISHIAAIPKGVIENGVGLSLIYYIPEEIVNRDGRIIARVFNEDGSLIDSIQNFKTRKQNGYEEIAEFGYPKTRNVKVVLLDTNNHILQEYQIYLNDLNKGFAIDD